MHTAFFLQKIGEAEREKEKDVDYLTSIEVVHLAISSIRPLYMAEVYMTEIYLHNFYYFINLNILLSCKTDSDYRSCRCYRNAGVTINLFSYLHFFSAFIWFWSLYNNTFAEKFQNWSHVDTVIQQLNKLPLTQSKTDINRIRHWYIIIKFFIQLIYLFSLIEYSKYSLLL